MQYDTIINSLQKSTERSFQEMNAITDNIMNATTPGYKAKRMNSFEEVIKDMDGGQLTTTGEKHHVTLDGRGFFVLTDEKGKEYLTRNLHIQVDKDNNLTSNGKYIMPPGKMDMSEFREFKVSKDGKINAIRQADGTTVPISELKVINYPDSNKLDYDGMFFRPNDKAGKSGEVALGGLHQTQVRQGMQEISNVDLPYEFVSFKQLTEKLRTLTTIMTQLNSAKRNYIQTLGQIGQGG